MVGASFRHQKVASLIPSQSTCLGCRFDPDWSMYRRQPIDTSLSLHSSLSKSIKIASGEDKKRKRNVYHNHVISAEYR